MMTSFVMYYFESDTNVDNYLTIAFAMAGNLIAMSPRA